MPAHMRPQLLSAESAAFPDASFKVYVQRDLACIAPVGRLSAETRLAMEVVSTVLPFRVNRYVIDELIDWDRVPDDPIFQLTFPQQGMLAPEHFDLVAGLLQRKAEPNLIDQAVRNIRSELNPHPADQLELNVPLDDQGHRLEGLQHKYRETVLFFPSQGQSCHAYCTFCFRWAQFVGDKTLRIASSEAAGLHRYLQAHTEVSDLLMTGGDPLVMKTRHLAAYLLPLLAPEFDHVQSLRVGTKALSFWPHRFLGTADADDLLRLLERLVRAGKHVALMAHINHWRELETPAVREAIRRLRDTGAQIRTQSPLVAHINDDPAVWTRLWNTQVRLGLIPYYMFVERDTGARQYFEVPLLRAWEVYRQAIQHVSGLARTARGPSMSASPGKVEIQGVAEVQGEQVFVLRFLQARNPEWVQQPFFARMDPEATWFDQLQPAGNAQRFHFEEQV